jgi:prostaglandin-E synthase
MQIPAGSYSHVVLCIYIYRNIVDIKDETITLTDSELKFVGKSQDKDYEVNIEFFKTIDSEGSTYKVLPRSVQMHILKKDKEEEEFWTRLLKDKALEKNQVKIDWDRYVDEDEEEEGFDMSNLEGGSGMGGPPGGGGGMPPGMGGMGGMGGMPGMGGMGGMPGMEGMGGMPGMEGMGGMDMEALVSGPFVPSMDRICSNNASRYTDNIVYSDLCV